MECRFIEEYANFKIRLLKKEKQYSFNECNQEKFNQAIERIKKAVYNVRKGFITVDECMLMIAKCFDF